MIRAIEGAEVCQDYEEPAELLTDVYGYDSDGEVSVEGLSIKTRFVSDSLTLGHDRASLAVFCREDEVATGGGFGHYSDYDVQMYFLSSLPVSAATSTGWSVTGYNKTNPHQKMTVLRRLLFIDSLGVELKATGIRCARAEVDPRAG